MTAASPTPLPVPPAPSGPVLLPRPRRSPVRVVLVLLLCGLIIAAGAASAYTRAKGEKKLYGAVSEVVYQSEARGDDEARQLATQADVVKSATVVEPVAGGLHMDASALRDRIDVESNQTNLLTIRVTDRAAASARRMAQLIGFRYARVATRPEGVTRTTAPLEARIRDLSLRARRLQARLDTTKRRSRQADMRLQLQLVSDRIGRLQDRVTDLLTTSGPAATVRIVTPGRVLQQPVSPQPARSAVLGGLVGFVIAALLFLALLRPRLATERAS